MNNKRVFIDQINTIALLYIIIFKYSYQEYYYFDGITNISAKLIRILTRTGILRKKIKRVKNHIGELKKENGELIFFDILKDNTDICRKIVKDVLLNNFFIKGFNKIWDVNKVVLSFEKELENYIRNEIMRVCLVAWINDKTPNYRNSCLCIKKTIFSDYILQYAYKNGVKIFFYSDFLEVLIFTLSFLKGIFKVIFEFLCFSIKKYVNHVIKFKGTKEENQNTTTQNYKIGMRYGYKTISFDDNKRSEFFWINNYPSLFSKIIIYDFVSSKRLDEKTKNKIKDLGIKIYGNGNDFNKWIPTPLFKSKLRETRFYILKNIAKNLIRKKIIPYFLINKIWRIGTSYAYWYDFYKYNNIKINIGSLNTNVSQVLALDSLQAASVSFQYTISNLIHPSKLLCSGETIKFVFSNLFKEIYREIDASDSYIVPIGFIYNHKKSNPEYNKFRTKLHKNGAKFILCYFDENCKDQWNSPFPTKDLIENYEYLLNWLISDNSLGIVFKPKNALRIFDRLKPISSLIEESRETGRCQFLVSENIVGSIYPSDAARIADICIGKLMGASASLEAALSGVPSVLIDKEGLKTHSFYQWGKDNVVFESWESLRNSIEQYRKNPQQIKIGDWSKEIYNLDPYTDGMASIRLSGYVESLLENISKGLTKANAMKETHQQFNKKWSIKCIR